MTGDDRVEVDRERLRRSAPRAVELPDAQQGGQAFVGRVTTAGTTTPGNYFLASPVSIGGTETEGVAATITDLAGSAAVYLVGPGNAYAGDLVIARGVGHRWATDIGTRTGCDRLVCIIVTPCGGGSPTGSAAVTAPDGTVYPVTLAPVYGGSWSGCVTIPAGPAGTYKAEYLGAEVDIAVTECAPFDYQASFYEGARFCLEVAACGWDRMDTVIVDGYSTPDMSIPGWTISGGGSCFSQPSGTAGAFLPDGLIVPVTVNWTYRYGGYPGESHKTHTFSVSVDPCGGSTPQPGPDLRDAEDGFSRFLVFNDLGIPIPGATVWGFPGVTDATGTVTTLRSAFSGPLTVATVSAPRYTTATPSYYTSCSTCGHFWSDSADFDGVIDVGCQDADAILTADPAYLVVYQDCWKPVSRKWLYTDCNGSHVLNYYQSYDGSVGPGSDFPSGPWIGCFISPIGPCVPHGADPAYYLINVTKSPFPVGGGVETWRITLQWLAGYCDPTSTWGFSASSGCNGDQPSAAVNVGTLLDVTTSCDTFVLTGTWPDTIDAGEPMGVIPVITPGGFVITEILP